MATSKPKASDKQAICRKLTAQLKKRYKQKPESSGHSVLETLLFAICLENATVEQAEAAFARLHESFYDLNEVRVSSITELEAVFDGMCQTGWRALAIRSVLQFVFEKSYSFDFDALKRKTLESAAKQLSKIRHVTPFVRNYTLQTVLGAHVVPLDEYMTDAVIWLGLAEPNTNEEDAAEAVKPALKKSEAQQFCHLLRCLANDESVRPTFEAASDETPEDGYDVMTAPDRLAELFAEAEAGTAKRPRKKTKKTAKKKTSETAPSVTRTSGSKSTAKKKKSTQRKSPTSK